MTFNGRKKKLEPCANTTINDTDKFVKAVNRRELHGFYFSSEIHTTDTILTIANDGQKLLNFKRIVEL
jgi:hypothetical protein